ncbi:MAG: hypothetical protein V3V18_08330 [Methylococcales bacterium]
MKKTTFCILMIFLLFGAQVFAATPIIERWIDDQDKHHYGQRPVGSKVQSKQASFVKTDKKAKKKMTKKVPKVYKKLQTRHKNPKDYSRKAY